MTSHERDDGWSNSELLLIFAFVNSRKNTIQEGIYSSIKFQKYILVKALPVYFRNRHQDFPGYSITVLREGGKGNQIFRYSRFSFTVMRKELLDFTKSLNTSYFEMDG